MLLSFPILTFSSMCCCDLNFVDVSLNCFTRSQYKTSLYYTILYSYLLYSALLISTLSPYLSSSLLLLTTPPLGAELRLDNAVKQLYPNSSGTRLVVIDNANGVYLFNPVTGKYALLHIHVHAPIYFFMNYVQSLYFLFL